MQITFTIPDDKFQRVVDAINGVYLMPAELAGTTPQQWAKERMRRFVIATVFRYEQGIAMDQVRKNVLPDDGIIT